MPFEVRPFLPIDLPLVRRLTPYGVSLDAATSLAHGIHTLGRAVASAVPLTDLGTPTLILRDGEHEFVAQFRHRTGESHAHIVFIAPDLAQCADDRGWLALVDAMTVAAGRRGALSLNAEIAETSDAFPLLRRAGFAVYARQEIWRRLPMPLALEAAPSHTLREATEADRYALENLYAGVVPRQVWQADSLPEAERGLIYEPEPQGRPAAYFAMHEGRSGIFVQVVMHPDLQPQAAAICQSWLSTLARAEKLPVYICVRRYQSWLETSLTDLGFASWDSQALLVKHTVARIERPLRKAAVSFENAVRLGVPAPRVQPRLKVHSQRLRHN